ncbi:MAG: protein kinase, partial [Gemmatimonadota bacterium]
MRLNDWDRIEKHFHELVSLDARERAEALREISKKDPLLGRDVTSLLEYHDTGGALDALWPRIAPDPIGRAVPDAPAPDLTNSVVGNYELGELIARGGMGDVYKGKDTSLDRDVALKFLPAWMSRDPSARDRLHVEARIVSSIDHPNVCTLLGMGEADDGRLFLIMPLYEGESLNRRMSRGPLPVEEAVDIAVQTARGLMAAHERGIVHRDIKPGNLLLTSDGAVKILDFGVAKLADVHLTRPGERPGTRQYMSPEQAAGKSTDARTDLWSLGVVLREMLTGDRPVGPVDAGSDDEAPGAAPPVASAAVPPSLSHVLDRLLAPEPESRYPDARTVIEDLSAAGGDARVWSRKRRTRRALPTARAAVAVLAVAALAVAAPYFGVLGSRSGPSPDAVAAPSTPGGAAASDVPNQVSIAVMAFANASADPDREYLAEGLSEELLNLLSAVPGVRVAARGSSFSFKDGDATVQEVAQTLGVDYVLDGSVRDSGDRVRISVRLIEAASESQVWGRSYDHELDDIFALLDEIAGAVTRALRVEVMSPALRTSQTTPEAYRLWLQARYLLRTPRTNNEEVEGLLNEALALDPDYVPAMLSLARVYNRFWVRGAEGYDERARDLVDRAYELEPENAYANGWLSWFAIFYDQDLETGARREERAFALDPTHIDLINGLQQAARIFGYYDEAIVLGEYQVASDPICSRCYLQLGYSNLVAGRLDTAEAAFNKVLTLGGGEDGRTGLGLGLIHLLRGDGATALEAFNGISEEILWGVPARTLGVALASHTLGRPTDFARARDELSAAEDSVRWLAPLYAWTGDLDRAFELLDAMPKPNRTTYNFLPVPQDPVYRKLWDDPRWATVLSDRGVSPEQLAAIDFKLVLPEVITSVVEEARQGAVGPGSAAP